MKQLLMSLTLIFSSFAWAAPAVLFDDVVVKDSASPSNTEITPLSQRSSFKNIYAARSFTSTEELRSHRRVGVGASAAGALAMVGAFIELNLTPSESSLVGFGAGDGFQAFQFQWKHLFTGRNFSPYAGIGYARWYSASSGANMSRTTPSVLGARFLSEEEKRSGKFVIDLLTPNLGIQYTLLNGESAGLGLYGEVDLLTKVPDLSPAPTGGLGILYYF